MYCYVKMISFTNGVVAGLNAQGVNVDHVASASTAHALLDAAELT